MKSMQFDHASTAPSFHRRLPPLHALDVFTAAARFGTFSRAARELHVTQGAVSRQIQSLEDHLGLTLFIRHKTGLRLTPEAAALLPVIEEAFGQVAKICESLRAAGQVLTLRMPPTLASRWFLPLLPVLRENMPDIDVRIATYDAREPRFEDATIDAAIIHGRGDWPDLCAIPLMRELLTPVCSPVVARDLKSLDDLVGLPFLHCESAQPWGRWLAAAGASHITSHRGQTFDTLELALAAAAGGQGVALGDLNLVRSNLEAGTLVAPFETILDEGIGYYLVYPEHHGQMHKILVLRESLISTQAGS
jgi:DNA-binding transcriptional LysR family regulator